MGGHLFQIDRDVWRKFVMLGLNLAVVYLVLASGTGRDNRTSLGRKLARRALDMLVKHGFVIVAQTGTRQPATWLRRPSLKKPEADAQEV